MEGGERKYQVHLHIFEIWKAIKCLVIKKSETIRIEISRKE